MKKLYRIQEGRKLAGVCGGVAEYLNIDPTVVRVIWALCCLWGGVGIAAYILCAVIMPEKPDPDIIDAD